MKNPNQAKSKTAKKTPVAPSQKPIEYSTSAVPLNQTDPLGDNLPGFVFNDLRWIGNSMEPEIFARDSVIVMRRESMSPCDGEIVLGMLKTGHLVFGVFHILKRDLYQIRYINPGKAPANYPPAHFRWLYPVDTIRIMREDEPRLMRCIKKLEFCLDPE